MEHLIIYNENDEPKCEALSLEYSGEFMGERYVDVTCKSEEPIAFAIGDYLTYRDEKFYINYVPPTEKQAKPKRYGDAFVYENIKMNSVADELTRCDFLDYVLSDNKIHYTGLSDFSFYAESVHDLADRIQANLNRLYKGGNKWRVIVDTTCTSPDKNISVQQKNCFEALALVNSEFYLNYTIKGRVITIGAQAVVVNHIFEFGQGNGLFSIKQETNQDEKIITRMRAFGSTKNLPYRYYNLHGLSESQYCPNLMLPDYIENGQDTYIDADGYQNGGEYNEDDDKIRLYGIREGTVYFDGSVDLFGTGEDNDIYPTIEYMTYAQVKAAGVDITQIPGDNGALNEILSCENPSDSGLIPTDGTSIPSTFKLCLKDFGADLSEREDGAYKLASTDGTMTISMRSGMCQGREFEIVENGINKVEGDGYVYYELTCNRVEDLSYYYPNNTYTVNAGDEFVIYNIQMPDVYVKAAEQRLLATAKLYLPEVFETKFNYTPVIDEKFMKEHPEVADTICEGMTFQFSDEDLGIAAIVTISHLTIKEDGGMIPTYEVTLNDDVEASTVDKITAQIDKIAGVIGANGSGVSTSQMNSLIQTIGSQLFISKTKDDRTDFNLNVGGTLTAEGKTQFGERFVTGMVGGVGGQIDENAHAELQSLTLREFLEVPELRFNRIDVVSGELWNSIAFGTIKSVDTLNQIATVKLEEGERCGVKLSDICRGIFSNFGSGTQSEDVDDCGFNQVYGFSTSYFTPTEILTDADGVFKFRYALKSGTKTHPSASMKFAVYGNFTDEDRQASAYATRTYKRYLSGVNTWVIDPDKHIVAQYGKLDGLQIGSMKMEGYGSFQSNAYFKGSIIELTPEQLATIKGESAYSVHLTDDEALVKVDASGNVILLENVNIIVNGENVTAEGENIITKENVLRTRIQASKGSQELFYSPVYADGAFMVSLKCVACEASVINGTIYVTSVSELPAYIDITVSCEGNASFEKRYTITGVSDGKTGVGMTSKTVKYAASETADQPSDDAFSLEIPSVSAGWYLWTWIHIEYSDGTFTDSYTYSRQGNDGQPGEQGFSPTFYELSPSNMPLNQSMTGKITPQSFVVTCYQTTGSVREDVIPTSWAVEASETGETWETYSSENYTTSGSQLTMTNIATKYTIYRISAEVAGQTVYSYATKAKDGAGVSEVYEYYAISDSGTKEPSINDFTTTVLTPTEDKPYLWNFEKVVYEDGTESKTSIHLIGYIGSDGRGIESITEYYLATTKSSGVTTSTSGWTTTIQTITSTKPYLWNYEIIKYTEGDDTVTEPHITGHFGCDGVGISAVYEYFAISDSSTTAPSNSEFSTDIPTPTKEKPYLWNYEQVKYTNGKADTTSIHVIGSLGDDGRGIDDVIDYYLATSADSGVTTSTSGWTTTIQTITDSKPYLWNYERIKFTEGDDIVTTPHIVGYHALDGAKGDTGSMPRYRGVWQAQSSSSAYVYDADYCDIVVYEGQAYKVKSFGASLTTQVPTNTSYWEIADYYSFVAMDTALIDGANIANFLFKNKVMRSQDTTTYVDKYGNTVEEPNLTLNGETGEIIANKMTARGTIIIGDRDGQRVEIAEATKDIKVYDKNGDVVNTFTGRICSPDDIFPTDSASASITSYNNKTYSFNAKETGVEKTQTYTVSTAITVPEDGVVSITFNALKAYIYSSASDDDYVENPYCEVRLYMQNTDGEQFDIASVMAIAEITSSSGGARTATSSKTSAKCKCSGTVQLMADITYYSGTSSWISCSGAWNVTSVEYLNDEYSSLHFNNGFIISRGATDLIAAYIQSTTKRMIFELLSNNNGLFFGSDGLKVKHNGSSVWKAMPMLLYKYTVKCTSTSTPSYSLACDYAFDNTGASNATLTVSGKGKVAITFPSSCPSISYSNCIVHAIAIPSYGSYDGGDAHYVSLYSIGTKKLTFYIADDDSLNNGSFTFDIWKIS